MRAIVEFVLIFAGIPFLCWQALKHDMRRIARRRHDKARLVALSRRERARTRIVSEDRDLIVGDGAWPPARHGERKGAKR